MVGMILIVWYDLRIETRLIQSRIHPAIATWSTIGVSRHDSHQSRRDKCKWKVADDRCIETRLIQSRIQQLRRGRRLVYRDTTHPVTHPFTKRPPEKSSNEGRASVVHRRCRWKSHILSRAIWCISRCGVKSSGVWEATMMIILI